MELDRNGLEVLGRDECLRLLPGARPGRVGVTSGALPTVLPIDSSLDGERVVVATGHGSRLDAAARDAVVAFEVDDVDLAYRWGCSVVVAGAAPPLGGGGDHRLMAITDHDPRPSHRRSRRPGSRGEPVSTAGDEP